MIGLMQPRQGVLPNSLGKAKFAVCEFRPLIGLTAPLPLFTSTRFAQRIRQKHTRHIFPLRGAFATDFLFGGNFCYIFPLRGRGCHLFPLRGEFLPPISSSGGILPHISSSRGAFATDFVFGGSFCHQFRLRGRGLLPHISPHKGNA